MGSVGPVIGDLPAVKETLLECYWNAVRASMYSQFRLVYESKLNGSLIKFVTYWYDRALDPGFTSEQSILILLRSKCSTEFTVVLPEGSFESRVMN